MRNFLAVTLAVFLALHPAFAARIGDDTVTIGRQGSSANKTVRMGAGRLIWDQAAGKMRFSNDAGGLIKDIGAGSGGSSGVQLLTDTNADIEAGVASGWTASGGSLTDANASPNLLFGGRSGVFNASATGQTVTNTAVTIPGGLEGGNGAASCWFKTTATDYKIQAVQGSNVLAERVIPALSVAQQVGITFPMPSSGTIALRLISQSNADDLIFDDCFLGSTSQFDLSQAELYGFLKYGTDCSWSRTAATYGDFTSDGSCTIQTSGNVQSVAGLPHFTASLPEGRYEIALSSPLYTNGANTTVSCRLIGSTLGVLNANGSFFPNTSGIGAGISIVSAFDVSSFTAAESFKVQCLAGAGAIDFGGSLVDGGSLTVSIKRFPSGSQRAQRFDTVAQSWSGYHADTCSWSFTTGSYAVAADDGSCTLVQRNNSNMGTVTTFGAAKPGITFAPPAVKKYEVCATIQAANATAGETANFRLIDSNAQELSTVGFQNNASTGGVYFPMTVCGQPNPSAVGTYSVSLEGKRSAGTAIIGGSIGVNSIEWSIKAINEQNPAPLIVGGVVSSSAGVERIERAAVTATCSVSPCTLASQTGGITSITRSATGSYAVNFAAGTFSATPTCVCMSGGVNGIFCRQAGTQSSTTFGLSTQVGTTDTDASLYVQCAGPR